MSPVLKKFKNCKTGAALIERIRNSTLEEIYVAALECQVKFCSREVREALGAFALWERASSVLDAGCGPGAFVNEFQSLFSGKKYTGIDIDSKFIRAARVRFGPRSRFRFKTCDLNKFTGKPVDVVLLWAVLQHLPDTNKALSRLARTARMGFVILDTRPDRYEFVSRPRLKTLSRYYDVLHEMSKKRGRNTDCLIEAKAWAKKAGWTVSCEQGFAARVATTAERSNFFYYACLITALFERKFGLAVDFPRLIKELQSWRSAKNAYVENRGGQWLCLERNDANNFLACSHRPT